MTRHKHGFLVIASLIVLLTSCAEKCDDFDYDIIEWMPYKKNDKIVLSNNNHRDTLSVNYSEIHHTDKIRFGVKCACVNSFTVDLSSETFDLHILFNDSKLIELSEIEINNEWLNYSEQLDNLTINEINYTNLIVYKNSNSTNDFQKIIVAKRIGIIAIVLLIAIIIWQRKRIVESIENFVENNSLIKEEYVEESPESKSTIAYIKSLFSLEIVI